MGSTPYFKKRDLEPVGELAWSYLKDESPSGVKGGFSKHLFVRYKCDAEILAQKLTDTLSK